MYSNYISVNKNFQSSVNLELDFGKASKIDEYIPTTDICDVIKRYIKSFLGYSKEHATTLVGPYGKGKSFLLLVLSFLVGKNKDTQSWTNLVEKIKNIDSELYELLLKIKEEKICLLPVLINSNYDNLTQSFQLALNDALKREGMENIIPASAFDVCLSVIKKWTRKGSAKEEILKKCKELHHINLNELTRELKNCSPKAYKQFEELYNCVNDIGLEFNPLVNNDIVKTYDNMVRAVSKYGYNGIFIIFDEFSKFLESNSSNLMKDLKIVQDFAELSARSHIFLCCVAHKSLSLYTANKKQESLVDAFKTVEGRFKEVRFNRSLNENYQMISSAIIKSKNGKNVIEKIISEKEKFYSNISSLPLFNGVKSKRNFYFDCFPLNPLTIFSLIEVAEQVAQNERTLFTFLSDTDDDSLNSFLHLNNEGLFNVDKIYDYFGPLLKKDGSDEIKNIWYRTESVLSKLDRPEERQIIKALSVLNLINNPELIPTNSQLISLAIDMDENQVNSILADLIERGYIRRNPLSNNFFFAHSNSKQIDEAVAVLKKTKCKNVHLNEVADSVNEKKYVLPRKYNENNKIIRFYRTVFMNENVFLKIPSFNFFFDENYCDGVVVYLIKQNIQAEQIHAKLLELNDERVIVKVSKSPVPGVFNDCLLNYACLNEFKKQKDLDELTKTQIDLIIQETEDDIHQLISSYFENDFAFDSVLYSGKESFNELLTKTMENIYNVKLVFNNELINKKVVTAQYQKAIDHVIDYILNGSSYFPYSETSPESSVKVAILDSNSQQTESSLNFRRVIETIKETVIQSEGTKKAIKDMVGFLSAAPYGVRDGVMPVIFAKAISELDDNAILYFQNKELELNSANLVKAVFNDKYKISFAKGAADQNEYLKEMLSLFKAPQGLNFRKEVFVLAKAIKQYFARLPQIVRMCSLKNNYLGLSDEFIEFKNYALSFDINPYEVIFIRIREIFKTQKYDDIFKHIKGFVENSDTFLNEYNETLKRVIKETLEIPEESSIKSGLKDLLSEFVEHNKKPILDGVSKAMFELSVNELSYDDKECVSLICKACTGQAIEDWDNDKSKIVIAELKKFKEEIKNAKTITDSSSAFEDILKKDFKIEGVSSLLKNNLESVLDEFSGSISPSEKIDVLLSLLKEIM